MNFQQLEYILAVEKHKHFALAAESCHVTQATLSAMIKKMEEEVGFKIFDRSRQPVVLTEEGIEVIALANKILNDRDELRSISGIATRQLSGVLKVGIIPTIANSLLPMVLPQVFDEFPDLKLNIVEITTDMILQQLAADKIDVGILATPLDGRDSQLEENILYYEAMMVYGVHQTKKKFISPREINDKKIWLLEEGNCFRTQSVTLCDVKEKSLQPENLVFEASSFDTLINMTDRFGGFTLVPELYYNLMPAEKQAKTRHFELPLPVREISMVYQRPYARKRSLDVLAEMIRDIVPEKLITHNYKSSDLSIIGI